MKAKKLFFLDIWFIKKIIFKPFYDHNTYFFSFTTEEVNPFEINPILIIETT